MSAGMLLGSIALATAGLAAGYALSGFWLLALSIVTLGVAWWLGQRRRWGWVPSIGLTLFAVAAAAGVWLEIENRWMLVGLVAALTAWDLGHFTLRLQGVGRIEAALALERIHLRRVLTVNCYGLLLGWAALTFPFRLGFGAALLLAILAIVGVSRTIGLLRSESD